IWLSSSSQPRRAFYSTSSFRQAIFEEFFFLLNRLRLRSACSFSSAGGAFYSVSTRCQPLLLGFEPLIRTRILRSKPPFEGRRILLESATVATLFFSTSPCFARTFRFRLHRKWCAL